MQKRPKPVIFGFFVPRAVHARCRLGPSGGQHCPHGTAAGFYVMFNIERVIKHTMATATAIAPAATAATTEQVDATATATEPAPKKWSKRSMEGIMVRNIKVDFDQSWALSKLVSHRMDQQRWAFNMAVKEKLDDPGTTKFDLNKMLTGWRHGKEWMEGGFLAQRAGLLLGLDAVQKFVISNGKKRSNKSLWKRLARRDREKEGIPDIDTAVNLPSNKWSNKKKTNGPTGTPCSRGKGSSGPSPCSGIPCTRATACCTFPVSAP